MLWKEAVGIGKKWVQPNFIVTTYILKYNSFLHKDLPYHAVMWYMRNQKLRNYLSCGLSCGMYH